MKPETKRRIYDSLTYKQRLNSAYTVAMYFRRYLKETYKVERRESSVIIRRKNSKIIKPKPINSANVYHLQKILEIMPPYLRMHALLEDGTVAIEIDLK
ncbi:MAG: hypothetical protein N2V78_09450 [Methanophagales archaeon]|nr:hypothetical protein [Methanophagales archaeon]